MSLGLAMGAASVLGNVFGNIMSSKQNNEFDDELSGRLNDLTSRFEKNYNTNFLDTDQGKSTTEILGRQFDDQTKKINNAAVVGGATPEAKNNATEKAQNSYGDSITKLAGYGTQYKDMKEREFNRRSDSLNNFYLQHEMSKGENWTNFMNNATNLGQSGIMAGAMQDPGQGGDWWTSMFPKLGGKGNRGVSDFID